MLDGVRTPAGALGAPGAAGRDRVDPRVTSDESPVTRRLVCVVRHRAGGAVSALSATGDLPAVTAIVGAAGDVEVRRASDVWYDADAGGWLAALRPWVPGARTLGAFRTRDAAVAAEVAFLETATGSAARRADAVSVEVVR